MRAKVLIRIQTRMGSHKAGTVGIAYNQCNGTAMFFPDGGGCATVPVDKLKWLPRVPVVGTRRLIKRESDTVKRVIRRIRRVER